MKKFYLVLITLVFLVLCITSAYALSFGQVDGTCFMNCMNYSDDVGYCKQRCTY